MNHEEITNLAKQTKLTLDNQQKLLSWVDDLRKRILDNKILGLVSLEFNNELYFNPESIGMIDPEKLLSTIEGVLKPDLISAYRQSLNEKSV